MITGYCKACGWFDKEHESLKALPDNLGYCRKHKPVVYGKEGRYYGGWPLVDQHDTCGEYREIK